MRESGNIAALFFCTFFRILPHCDGELIFEMMQGNKIKKLFAQTFFLSNLECMKIFSNHLIEYTTTNIKAADIFSFLVQKIITKSSNLNR